MNKMTTLTLLDKLGSSLGLYLPLGKVQESVNGSILCWSISFCPLARFLRLTLHQVTVVH